MDFFAQTCITFTAELSLLDITPSKLSTEDMLVSASIDATSYFLLSISQLCRNESFSRKAVLQRHAKIVSDSISAASALLASASVPSSVRCGLGRCSVWASFWRGLCARAPGYCSRSVRARRLNSATTRALGVLGRINCRQWSTGSVALACPHRSLEGLVRDSKNLGWERASIFASSKRLIALVPYVRLRDYHWTTMPFHRARN